MATPKQIVLSASAGYQQVEGEATEAITPGFLVEFATATTIQKHDASGGLTEKLFALENGWAGKAISDAYATGETVFAYRAQPGDVVYAYLATGNNAAFGARLVSNGDGYLKVETEASGGVDESYVGVATEAVNASAAALRIRIRVL
jgi:hypothetical protein